MDITKILDYQKLDSELFKLEKSLKENQNKKLAFSLQDSAKKAQERSSQLENRAESLVKEIETVQKQYEIQSAKMKEIFAKDVDKLSKEEVEQLLSLKDKLAQNLVILDKNMTKLAENVNAVLADFNKTRKIFASAKENYSKAKDAYDNEAKAIEPQMTELRKKLENLEKSIDAKVVEQYKKHRNDNIFPVFVPLSSNLCGYCHMELPAVNISKIKDEGHITCEHCRRIIYNK